MGTKALIGVAGPAGVGKDTAARYLARTFHLEHYAFAGPIKDALSAMGFERGLFDQDGFKDEPIPDIGVSYRKLAQTLGTEWGRSIVSDFWLRLAVRRHSNLPDDLLGMVISDVRFDNEAAWVRQHGLLIHIVGPSRREIAGDGKSHSSEVPLDRKMGDVIVTNTGSETFLCGQLHNAVMHAFEGRL